MGGVSMSRRRALAGTAAVAGAVVAARSAQAAAAVLREYQAVKTRDGKPIKLVLYRKRIGNGKLPVLFMVHGSSTSARTSFDLQVPGAAHALATCETRFGFWYAEKTFLKMPTLA